MTVKPTTASGTYTVAYLPEVLLAIIPDGHDIEAALAEEEEQAGEKFDRDEVVIESGLVLTDEPENTDNVIWRGHSAGWITDENDDAFGYIVRRG